MRPAAIYHRELSMSFRGSHLASPHAMLASLWRNRGLILQLTRREVLSRYRGSVMGLAWSFFNPLLMLAVYTFVFSVVFKARWANGGGESKAEFAIILFLGLIIHGLFAECLNRAPGIVRANINYVKKIVFPLEILICVTMGSALFHSAISLCVLFAVQICLGNPVPWTMVFLPVVLVPLLLGTIGLAWIVASLGVYVRDVGQVVGVITMVLLFLSPVFYPASALPGEYRVLFALNPLTFIIEEARRVALWGRIPDWDGLLVYGSASLFVMWAGFWWFQKTRKGFGDVV